MKKHVAVIGAGFGGLSCAAYLAQAGYKVTVLEKNSLPGGRANVIKKKGFTFDAGPSWYMMPDVFDEFFGDFGYHTKDFFLLTRLNPAYQVVTNNSSFTVPSYPKTKRLIAQLDSEAKESFEQFYQQTKKDYRVVRRDVLNQPMVKARELLQPSIINFLLGRDMYRSYHRRIRSVTRQPDLQHTLEFMSVFMGGSPKQIPGIYALLAYVDMGLGVFYPQGGFGVVAKAFEQVAKKQGATIHYNSPVEKIVTHSGRAKAVQVNGVELPVDAVVANADYQFVEARLLATKDRHYQKAYWQKADISPSGLLLFLGVNQRLANLRHHNLFFDTDWDEHFTQLQHGRWATQPLFYVSVPSKTDTSVAPTGSENLFVLAPMPPGKQASEKTITQVSNNIIERIEKQVGSDFRGDIVVQEARAHNYFKDTFHAYQGNAFGMSHTLKQSAVFRPKMQSKQIDNLFYAGQYTNPGTGVPMVVLSGKVAAGLVQSKV